MTSYANLSSAETFFMTLIVLITNLIFLPLFLRVVHRRPFQAMVFFMSMITSLFYHLCEIHQFNIFLDQLQWHRLDNIFAITSFQIAILHLSGVLEAENQFLRWFTLISSIIIQQKDPWNIHYTIWPCILCVLFGLGLRFLRGSSASYDIPLLRKGVVAIVIGMYFFFVGLERDQDYLRIHHGIWHICASSFGYYTLQSVQYQQAIKDKFHQ